MGGEKPANISSGNNENLPPQEAGANLNDTNNKKFEPDEWKTFEWFGDSRGGLCQDDILKWIFLALEEPTDSSEKQVIEKGLIILRNEIGEIFKAGMMDEKIYNFCFDALKSCHDYMMTKDASIKEIVKEDLHKKIFEYLKIDFGTAKYIVEIVRKISVPKRSVLRFMTHQRIQAKVAYIRTASMTHQKSSDMEGYHCTTNPYYGESTEKMNKFQSACVSLNSSNQELRQQLQDIQSKLTESEKLQSSCVSLNSRNQELRQQLIESEKVLGEQIELNTKLVEEKEQLNDAFKNEYAQLKNEMDIIKNESESAKSEAVVYQAALGNATNVRWSDDTLNNPIQLTKDIQKLRQHVDEFTKVKGKAYKIKEQESLELLKSYDNFTLEDTKRIKTLLSFALQKLTLKTIFDAAENVHKFSFSTSQYNDATLEFYTVYYAEELIKCSSRLASNREGSDSIASITPIKIRQQIYASLALRAFSNDKHPYIKRIADDLIGNIERYREIIDEDKKKELRSETESLIRAGIQFWFSLRAQEPVPKIKWHNPGNPITTHSMEGNWDASEIEDLEVGFCYFPSIVVNKQIYCKASVAARPKVGKVHRVINQVRNFIVN